jgi:hypothetical protein
MTEFESLDGNRGRWFLSTDDSSRLGKVGSDDARLASTTIQISRIHQLSSSPLSEKKLRMIY